MTLDESYDEINDLIVIVNDLNFIYERKVSPYLEDKIVDYQTGPNEGFAIYGGNGAAGCGPESDCDPGGGCGDGCCH